MAIIYDKFPIPIIDELRCLYFLQVGSGYYQICMYADDIHKMTFRISHGHFEFVIMPFELTNALTTF